jgi:AraC-like DNA-binding protein
VNELAHQSNNTKKLDLDINDLGIGNLSHKIELLIGSYIIGCKPPSIESVAQFLKLSERTLRRRLTEEGTTFAQILSSWRIRKSIGYLKNSDYSVNEIAHNLHYSCDSNYIRAFKRTFSVSPETFREL